MVADQETADEGATEQQPTPEPVEQQPTPAPVEQPPTPAAVAHPTRVPVAHPTPAAVAHPTPAPVAHPTPAPVVIPTARVPLPTPAQLANVATQSSAVPYASGDPRRWGRVDDDGTVYLRTADGERAVGCWQAGTPEEGLAHFARRFDDLVTEADLLAARLSTGGGDPKHTLSSAQHLRDGLATASVVGDLEALAGQLDELISRAQQAVAEARTARDANRTAAIAKKEALAAEAEQIAAETTQWKQAGDRFKAILEEWRAIRGVDRKTDEILWKRFSKARDGFNRRRGSHFADLDRQRVAAKARKEELVAQAEALVESSDWGETATKLKELMVEWKAAGRAQKDTDDALWQRFRTAQDAFFSRRSATFAERDAELVANAAAKEALLAEAERIDTADPNGARAQLRAIHDRWEAIGKVPRERIREFEARLKTVEDKVRNAADNRWRRTDPEAEARVAQFRERVEQYEAQAAKARAAGDQRRADEAQGQAEQWREWLATAENAIRS